MWCWVTIAIAAITVAVVFTVPENFYPWSYLRNALGIIFVLWLPGFAIIKALFPVNVPIKTSSENLDAIERIVLSLGMSLALVPIIGLILNYTPWGISLSPIILSLFALTLASATVAMKQCMNCAVFKNNQKTKCLTRKIPLIPTLLSTSLLYSQAKHNFVLQKHNLLLNENPKQKNSERHNNHKHNYTKNIGGRSLEKRGRKVRRLSCASYHDVDAERCDAAYTGRNA